MAEWSCWDCRIAGNGQQLDVSFISIRVEKFEGQAILDGTDIRLILDFD